jgi:hypothetical protein
MDQRAELKLDQDTRRLEEELRQGCCFSPSIFNLYSKYIIKGVLEGFGGLKI